MKKIVSIFLLFTVYLIAEEITVATAANVQYAMEELKKAFKRSTGITVHTVVASSGKLAAQIKSGAPFDLFLSANMKYPKYLRQHRFAVNDPKIYAYGSLVLWTLKPIELDKGIKSLLNPKIERIAIPNPKNAPSNLAIIGRYILTPDIFGILKETKSGHSGEIQITDALMTQAKRGMVLAYKFKGKRFDCGSIDGFVEATNYFYKKLKS